MKLTAKDIKSFKDACVQMLVAKGASQTAAEKKVEDQWNYADPSDPAASTPVIVGVMVECNMDFGASKAEAIEAVAVNFVDEHLAD